MSEQSFNRRAVLGSLGIGTAGWLAGAGRLKAAVPPLPVRGLLPDFSGATAWLNTPSPLSVAQLKGHVLLVHIWTFACINCQRTLPYVVEWHHKYNSQGLRVVGIHTPEFPYERDLNNIRQAIGQRGITYPNAVDNDFRLWRAYENQYWPHLFLADRQGRLRYDHIGEGAYDTTEQAIRALLSST